MPGTFFPNSRRAPDPTGWKPSAAASSGARAARPGRARRDRGAAWPGRQIPRCAAVARFLRSGACARPAGTKGRAAAVALPIGPARASAGPRALAHSLAFVLAGRHPRLSGRPPVTIGATGVLAPRTHAIRESACPGATGVSDSQGSRGPGGRRVDLRLQPRCAELLPEVAPALGTPPIAARLKRAAVGSTGQSAPAFAGRCLPTPCPSWLQGREKRAGIGVVHSGPMQAAPLPTGDLAPS
jgi:hypothetical protein